MGVNGAAVTGAPVIGVVVGGRVIGSVDRFDGAGVLLVGVNMRRPAGLGIGVPGAVVTRTAVVGSSVVEVA